MSLHPRYLCGVIYDTLFFLFTSFGPVAEQVVVQLLVSNFPASFLGGRLFRSLDPPALTAAGPHRLVEPYTIPILDSLPVLRSTNLPLPVLPPSLVSPPPEPPLMNQGFLESTYQITTDLVVYVEEPSNATSGVDLTLLFELTFVGIVFLIAVLGAFIILVTGGRAIARGFPRLWTSAKNRFLADLDALLEPTHDLFFPMRTADPIDMDSENMSSYDLFMDTVLATTTQLTSSRTFKNNQTPSQASHCNGSIPESFNTKVNQEDPISTQGTSKVRIHSTSSRYISVARESIISGKQMVTKFYHNTPARFRISVKDTNPGTPEPLRVATLASCQLPVHTGQDEVVLAQNMSTERTDFVTASRIRQSYRPSIFPSRSKSSKSLSLAFNESKDTTRTLSVTSVREEEATNLYRGSRSEVIDEHFESSWMTWGTLRMNARKDNLSGEEFLESNTSRATDGFNRLSEMTYALSTHVISGSDNLPSNGCNDDLKAESTPSLDTSAHYSQTATAELNMERREDAKLLSQTTTDVDLTVSIPHVDPHHMANLLPSDKDNFSLHRKALLVSPHLFNLPLCEDGHVPQNRRLSASMHACCITSDYTAPVSHGLFPSESEDTITASVTEQYLDVKNTAKLPIATGTACTSNSATTWQKDSLLAVLLPLSKRTHILSGRSLYSSDTRAKPPVILSYTIDISLTRYSHPRDTEWDSFETNHQDGMPQSPIFIPGWPRRVRPNSVISSADKHGEVDRWISGRLLRPAFSSSLPLDRRAVQRPEIFYSTSKGASVSAKAEGLDLISRPPSSLLKARQLDRVKMHIAAANKLADDRRKAMYYSKPAVSHDKVASVPIPCDRTGVTSEDYHIPSTLITERSVAIKYVLRVDHGTIQLPGT